MSRREDRESDSRRHRSRFDREPSPKRSRRDGKPTIERSETFDLANQNQKQHRRQQDALLLEASSAPNRKVGSGSIGREADKKANGNHESNKHSFDPTEAPRSQSYYKHEERDNSRQAGRRPTNERGGRDAKDHQNEAPAHRSITNESRHRDEKMWATENDNWHRKKFNGMEADLPPARKRRTFSEKKIPLDSEKNEDEKVLKSSHSDHPMLGSEKEGRDHGPRHLDRSEKPLLKGRAFNNDVRRGPYQSRERYGGGGGGNYRGGRERFSRMPEHRSSGIRVEKWKHDLFEEANKSPSPKNEEEQIAKVEALLAS